MGREVVFKKINKSAIENIVSAFVFIFASFIVALFVMDDARTLGLFIITFFLLVAITQLVIGIKDLINPMKSAIFKKNPFLLEEVDNMIANKKYEDNYIMISDRCIASKKDITYISYLEYVFLIYIPIKKNGGFNMVRQLIICTATGDFAIEVLDITNNTINELVSKLGKICPNARLGYNDEGLRHLQNMRDLFNTDIDKIKSRGYTQNLFIMPQFANNSNQGYSNQNQFVGNMNSQNTYNQYNDNSMYSQNTYNQYYDNNSYNQNTYNQQ